MLFIFIGRIIYICYSEYRLKKYNNINKTEDINLNGLSVNEILQQVNHSECV